MVGGMTGVLSDVIPFGLSLGNRNNLVGLNLIGLRRAKISNVDIKILQNSYDVILNSTLNKITISKDKKGNATQFSMNISIDIKIIDSSNNQTINSFSETSAYDNSNNKFDLRKYEDNLIKNMTEKIFSEIILFIQTNN